MLVPDPGKDRALAPRERHPELFCPLSDPASATAARTSSTLISLSLLRLVQLCHYYTLL